MSHDLELEKDRAISHLILHPGDTLEGFSLVCIVISGFQDQITVDDLKSLVKAGCKIPPNIILYSYRPDLIRWFIEMGFIVPYQHIFDLCMNEPPKTRLNDYIESIKLMIKTLTPVQRIVYGGTLREMFLNNKLTESRFRELSRITLRVE